MIGLQLPGNFRVAEHKDTGERQQRFLGIVVHSTYKTLEVSISISLLSKWVSSSHKAWDTSSLMKGFTEVGVLRLPLVPYGTCSSQQRQLKEDKRN